MIAIPDFFTKHQIAPSASEREIKLAYSKALKLIDQEHDLSEFQSLHEDYTEALNWVRNPEVPEISDFFPQETEIDRDSETAIQQSLDEPVADTRGATDTPILIANRLFDEFLQTLRNHSEEKDQTEKLLQHYLNNDHLINIEIRQMFESLLAKHLMKAWQIENGDLFEATVKSFSWNMDQHRLLNLNTSGYFIQRAIDEMCAFHQQSEPRILRQLNLIRLSRSNAEPTKQFLRENYAFIDDLLENYPNYLQVMTNYKNVLTWKSRCDDYKFFRPSKLKFNGPISKYANINEHPNMIFLILFIIWKIMN